MTKHVATSGLTYSLLSAFLWALFPIFTTLSFSTIAPLWSAAIGAGLSTLFFLGILIVRGQWKRGVSREGRKQILTACLLIGVGYYATQYIGISRTTPGNAAIVSLMEVFFSYLFLSVFARHEKFVPAHALGASLMIVGTLFILIPHRGGGFHSGDLIILAGSALPPLGNLAMQQARKEVSASYIMFWRSLAGCLVLSMLASASGGIPSAADLRASLPVLLFTGFILLGFSKILWIEAIHRLPITQTISIASVQPLITMVFAFFILHQAPQVIQLLSLPPMVLGMFLLTRRPPVAASGLMEI